MEHSAQNNYHAGLLRLERRFDKGLSFISSYTFARTIDDYGNLNDATGFWAQNAYDKKAEKGLSQFHAKNRSASDISGSFRLAAANSMDPA